MQTLSATTRATLPFTLCTSAHLKLIGTTDGSFPDFGHHSEREMGGLWMHPIKLLDGFWLRFQDMDALNVNTWALADACRQECTGNSFQYLNGLGHTSVTIRRDQLAPEETPGLILTYTFTNHHDQPRRIQVEWRVRTDLRPCWFTEDAGAFRDGRDIGHWQTDRSVFLAQDELNPWTVLVQCQETPERIEVGDLWTPQGSGLGTAASFLWNFTLSARGETRLHFRITGSARSLEEAEERLAVLSSREDWLPRKQARMDGLLAYSALETDSDMLDPVWRWLKAHTEWLTVDAGLYGRGLAAGLPEYPWWFGCDSAYAIQGLLCTGRFRLAADTLRLLARYSEKINGNGRIPHEITPFGLCPNPGNTQETAHYVNAVWHYYRWTQDRSLIRELLPLLRKSMAWLTVQDEDGDGLPSGYGIIEIRGLDAEMIDTAAYTSQAWGCFAELLEFCDADVREIAEARKVHHQIRRVLNTVLWDEETGSFCDVCADPAFVRQKRREILAFREDQTSPAEEASFETMLSGKEALGRETGFLINRNWTIATPMESGEADPEKADRALEFLWTPELIGPWGTYLSAMERRTMTISTGCFAVAYARWGYPNRALELLERMCATFGMSGPGMLSEMSPDYGCCVQGWTAYALFVPVVRYFFGIQPNGDGELRIAPCMPAAWKRAKLEKVRLPGGHLSVWWQVCGTDAELTLCADFSLRAEIAPVGYSCAQREISLAPETPVCLKLCKNTGL